MSVELLDHKNKPTPSEQLQRSTADIFKYYSVPNEIEFLRRTKEQGLAPKDTDIYIQENVERFLGEFAGQVPYARLSYLQKDGRMTYAGMDLTDSYRNVARNSERETDEYTGYSQIQEGFDNGAHTAVWISPPKMADYGFVFYFQRDPERPDHIREYILRYDEKRGELAQSQKILDRIDPMLSHQSDRDYLQKPYIFYEQDGNHPTLQSIMAGVGINTDQIQSSQNFELQIRHELGDWIALYKTCVFGGDIEGAKQTLRSIFNRASDIRDAINVSEQAPHYEHQKLPVDPQLLGYYANQERTVKSGSCPVSQTNFGDPFSPTSIIDQLNAGKTINGITNESPHFTCPNCNTQAEGPIGDQCPSCKITREEWAEKGHVVC